MADQANPPPGAGQVQAAAPGQAGADPYMMNTRPLSEPVNAFLWAAAVSERYLPAVPPAMQADAQHRIAWLRELGQRVDIAHVDPVIMIALSRMALDQRLRHQMAAAINQIEQVTQAATTRANGGR